MYIQSPDTLICQEIVTTLERWPLARVRTNCIYSISGIDLRHEHNCAMSTVVEWRNTNLMIDDWFLATLEIDGDHQIDSSLLVESDH